MGDRSLYFKPIDHGNDPSQIDAERQRILDAQKQIQEQRDRLMAERRYLEGLVERLKEQEKFRALQKRKPFDPVNYSTMYNCPKPPLLPHLQTIPPHLMPSKNTSFDASLHTTYKAPEGDNMMCNRMDQNLGLNIPHTSVSMPADSSANCSTESLEADIDRLIKEMGRLMIICSPSDDE